jgi:hypothetical protein
MSCRWLLVRNQIIYNYSNQAAYNFFKTALYICYNCVQLNITTAVENYPCLSAPTVNEY